MTDLWPLLIAFVLGGVIVEALMPAPALPALWMRWAWRAALAVPAGMGATSLIYFALTWSGALSRISILVTEGALLAACIAVLWRRGAAPAAQERPGPSFTWNWLLRIAVLLALALFLAGFQVTTAATPHGEWDASFIWNLRARFLASGTDAWRYAVAPSINQELTGASHPGYPLLLSAFIARGWVLAGAATPAAPAATSLAGSLATLLLLFAAVAWRRSESLALLAVLILLASELWVAQASMQYSDVLVGLALLGAVAFCGAAIEDRWTPRLALIAGLMGGLAAWTKNEGLVVLLGVLALVLWRGGLRPLGWAAAGSLPPALATLLLKTVLVTHVESTFSATPSEVLARITSPDRWLEAAKGYADAFAHLGFAYAHPLLLLAALVFVLRGGGADRRRNAALAALPVAALFAGGFGAFLVTSAQQGWHIGTAVSRLVAQLWPALLYSAILALKTPEETAAVMDAGKRRASPAPAGPPDHAPLPPRRPRRRPHSG